MKDIVGTAAIVLFIVLFGLLMSVVDSCQAYEDCLKAHSIKTCKQHFGKDDDLDESIY